MKIGVSAMYMRHEGSYRNAGISRYTTCLIDAFVEAGTDHEFDVFVHRGFVVPERWAAAHGFRFHAVIPDSRGRRALWEHFSAPRIAGAMGLDVWFSTGNVIPLFGGVPRLVMVHDLIPVLFPEMFRWEHATYQRWALRFSCSRAEGIVTNSEATRRDILRVYRVPESRVTVTPLGPGHDVADARPDGDSEDEWQRLGVPFRRFFFVLGTLEPRKNLVRLLEAMAQLGPACDEVGLVVAGGRGWKESPVFARIEALGIRDRVCFLGYVPDESLPLLFAKCEAFVFPSLYEGFGMPVLEAMAGGAPVLCSRTPAVAEVGGDAVALFDPEDASDIARAMREFLDSGDSRDERVARGRGRAKEFVWSRTARITLDALARVHGARG